MTGTFWNGNILSADFCGYGTANVGAPYPSACTDEYLNGQSATLGGFQPLLDAGYTTSRSQDAFFMPGIIPGPIMQNTSTASTGLGLSVDDVATSALGPGCNRNEWENPDYVYRPLLAIKNVATYLESDVGLMGLREKDSMLDIFRTESSTGFRKAVGPRTAPLPALFLQEILKTEPLSQVRSTTSGLFTTTKEVDTGL